MAWSGRQQCLQQPAVWVPVAVLLCVVHKAMTGRMVQLWPAACCDLQPVTQWWCHHSVRHLPRLHSLLVGADDDCYATCAGSRWPLLRADI